MKTAVWYDAGCDVIWISSHEEPFAPRTLRALLDDAGRIHIRRVGQDKTMAGGTYADFTDGAGFGFLSDREAPIYLDEVFVRRPEQAVTTPALIALGGHRVISVTEAGVGYASSDDPASVAAVLGITESASEPGIVPSYRTAGALEEPSWSFAIGPVFLGLAGALTQTAPEAGAVLQVGVAASPTRLLVGIQEPYFLAS